jgi:hypothetical protein
MLNHSIVIFNRASPHPDGTYFWMKYANQRFILQLIEAFGR